MLFVLLCLSVVVFCNGSHLLFLLVGDPLSVRFVLVCVFVFLFLFVLVKHYIGILNESEF